MKILTSRLQLSITAATEPLDASVRNRLNVIKQQLEGKLSTLDGMNKDILERCDPGVIVTEIEESDAIVTKVISCKFKIDELLAVTSSSTSAHPSPAPVAPTTIPVVTSKPRLPKFNGDVTRWTIPFGILSSQLLMRTPNSLRLINSITCIVYWRVVHFDV